MPYAGVGQSPPRQLRIPSGRLRLRQKTTPGIGRTREYAPCRTFTDYTADLGCRRLEARTDIAGTRCVAAFRPFQTALLVIWSCGLLWTVQGDRTDAASGRHTCRKNCVKLNLFSTEVIRSIDGVPVCEAPYNAVAVNIRERARQRAAGQYEPKGIKTALVVQGGALRGIASCASAAALDYLNLSNAFDKVYGISSGALNAAYFLTNQAALGVTVYSEDVTSSRFFDPFRVRNMMDLEYLFRDIVLSRKLHDHQALVTHPTELLVVVTDYETGEPVWFSSKDTSTDLYQVMKASCALPLISGCGVAVSGRHFLDSFVNEAIPLTEPLAHGYTDILVLMTRRVTFREPPKFSLPFRLIVNPILRSILTPVVYDLFQTKWKRYNEMAELIQGGAAESLNGNHTRIAHISPDLEPGRFEKNAAHLLDTAYSSWRKTFTFFGVSEGASRAEFDATLLRSAVTTPHTSK